MFKKFPTLLLCPHCKRHGYIVFDTELCSILILCVSQALEIVESALEKGLITPSEADDMDEEIYNSPLFGDLLWLPSFRTWWEENKKNETIFERGVLKVTRRFPCPSD